MKEKGKKKKMKQEKSKSKSSGRSKYFGKTKMKCWNYEKFGHFHQGCKEKNKTKKTLSNSESNKSSQDDANALVVALEMHGFQYVWLIDASDSFHMTSHWDWFSKYESYDGGKV